MSEVTAPTPEPINRSIGRDWFDYLLGLVVFTTYRGWIWCLFWGWFVTAPTGWRDITLPEGIGIAVLSGMVPGGGMAERDYPDWMKRLFGKWTLVLIWGALVRLALVVFGQ